VEREACIGIRVTKSVKIIFFTFFYVCILLSNEYWTYSNIRNGRVSTSCSVGSNNRALTFGERYIFDNNNFVGSIISHAALTNVISLNNIFNNSFTCQSSITSFSTSSMILTSRLAPTPSVSYQTTAVSSVLHSNSQNQDISMALTEYSKTLYNTESFGAISTTLPGIASSQFTPINLSPSSSSHNGEQILTSIELSSLAMSTSDSSKIPTPSQALKDTLSFEITSMTSTSSHKLYPSNLFLALTSQVQSLKMTSNAFSISVSSTSCDSMIRAPSHVSSVTSSVGTTYTTLPDVITFSNPLNLQQNLSFIENIIRSQVRPS